MVATRFSCLSFALISAFSAIGKARAQSIYSEGLYGWYEAGPALVEEAKLRNFPGEPDRGNPVKFDTGFHFGIAVGQELTRYVSVELESGFNYNALRSIGDATSSSGNFYRVPVMGNLVFQCPNRTRLVPVIGAGVGAHWSVFDAQNVALGATALDEDGDAWSFAYQGYAGLRYQFRENMNLGLFYHYNVTDSPSWKFNSAGGNFKLDSLRTHSLSLTLGWYF